MIQPTKEIIAYWKQCYRTPEQFLTWLEGDILPTFGGCGRGFTLDVCAEPWNLKCPEFIGPPGTMACPGMVAEDGLTASWKTSGVAWCNPGFSNVWPWLKKAKAEARAEYSQCSYVLTHAAHAAEWAQWALKNASYLLLINPRINFEEDPRLVDYLATQGKKPTGNNRDSMLWIFSRDFTGECRVINPPPWRCAGRGKAA